MKERFVMKNSAKSSQSGKASSVLGSKRPLNSILRYELTSCTQEEKEKMVQKLKKVKAGGARIGKHFIVGTNSIARTLERGEASVLVIPRDSPACLYNHLVEAALERKVPIVIVPKFAVQLRECLQLKSASSLALKAARSADKKHKEEEDMLLDSSLDDLREFLLDL